MTGNITLSTLTKRRAEIDREVRKLKTDLRHLDATIKLMQPGYKAVRHGTVVREILTLLRNAKEPMTTDLIAAKLEAEREQVKDALKAQRKKGLVKGTQQSGENMVWEIVG